MAPPARVATLVLCDRHGNVLGVLPPFRAALPWWQDAESLVSFVRAAYGVDVSVLRLLDAELPAAPGGAVTYLAEVEPDRTPGLPLSAGSARSAWAAGVDDHPLRLPYAAPGGPARDLAWADDRLAELGLRRRGAAQQIRTWNLSSLWRIPLESGTVWLKHVPPFFAHEGAVLELLRDAPVPRLAARDDGRILMPEIAGVDLYDAPLDTLLTLVSMLVDLQVSWLGRIDELFDVGLPDWRGPALGASIAAAVRRTATQLSADQVQVLGELVEGLPDRFAELEACGIPDTLVHGDFAPGNARGEGERLVLLDWGDCAVGHPLLDQSSFLDRIHPELAAPVRRHWRQRWRQAVPGCDPARAAALIAPVAAARQAVVYLGFLDRIEPSEHPYHRADPAHWLARAAAVAGGDSVGTRGRPTGAISP